MQNIIFYITLIIVLFTVGVVVKYRKNLSLCFRLLAISITIALFLLMGFSDGRSVFLHFFYALQVESMNADYSGIFDSISGNDFKYRILFYIISAFAPIICGGFFASFFDDFMQRVSFKILRRFYNIYFISTLNENSLELAESISKKDKKSLIVFFCEVDNESVLKKKARNLDFIVLPLNYDKLIFKSNHYIKYFLMENDEQKNLQDGLKLLNLSTNTGSILKKDKLFYQNRQIYVFSESDAAELILNATDKKGFPISLINKRNRIVQSLLFDNSLYLSDSLSDKKLSILIVGAGTLGLNFVKNALWCGQFGEEINLVINIVDIDAISTKKILEHDCPEFFNSKWNCKINFFNADVNTSDFEKTLRENCLDTDYAAVCFDDDELSIKTAVFLRRFFIINDKEFENEPIITVRVKNDEKAKIVKELTAINKEKISLKGWDIYSSKAENFNLIPFGMDESIYSYEGIIENTLDKLSLNAHCAYQNMFSSTIVDSYDVIKSFNNSEIDKKSNRANMIHIRYKLHLLGFDMKLQKDASELEIKRSKILAEELNKKLSDSQILESLGRMEHDRWLMFQCSEGWRSSSVLDAKKYSLKTGSHKHIRAKLHPCICTWNELDEITNVFDPHLKEYDTEFIKMIPKIIGLEESSINISNVKFILIENK